MKFRRLNADEIDVRVAVVKANGCSVLLYKDARVDMNILDETVGPERWQRAHEVIDGNLYCNVGIWFERRGDGFGDWVWKQDVGTESYTEKEKGQASDSFKRACFNWGIGRELYTAPFIWISSTQTNIVKAGQHNDKYTVKDHFYVDEIGYDKNGKINKLVIKNDGDNIVYSMGKKPKKEEKKKEEKKKEEQTDVTVERITAKEAKVLEKMMESRPKMLQSVLKRYGVKDLTELTKVQCAEVHDALKKFEEQLQKAEELKEIVDANEGKVS